MIQDISNAKKSITYIALIDDGLLLALKIHINFIF